MTRFQSRIGIGFTGLAMLLIARPAIAHPGHGHLMLSRLISANLTPTVMLTGVGVAFLAGAWHALTPGHGKTMVAAYLVGSQGTSKHAVFLGLVTTITHTIGVFTLGLIALFASRYILPEQIYPVLSLLSGLMVCGIGLWLLDSQLNHASAHLHSHSQEAAGVRHHHAGGKHNHPHRLKATISGRSLLTLGITGGIVPCPSALVLLLAAIALHQAAYGLVLVSAFSLGLASVLVAVGLAVVHAKRWLDLMPSGGALLRRYLPTASAIAMISVGIVITACSVI